jgi:hypothetical protein
LSGRGRRGGAPRRACTFGGAPEPRIQSGLIPRAADGRAGRGLEPVPDERGKGSGAVLAWEFRGSPGPETTAFPASGEWGSMGRAGRGWNRAWGLSGAWRLFSMMVDRLRRLDSVFCQEQLTCPTALCLFVSDGLDLPARGQLVSVSATGVARQLRIKTAESSGEPDYEAPRRQ